jgi:hypothetical protein
LTRAWELRKLSCKLSLLNSHQLSCNSCSPLTRAQELRKLSCKLSLWPGLNWLSSRTPPWQVKWSGIRQS